MSSGKPKPPKKGPDKSYPPSVPQPSGSVRHTPILTPSNESYEAFVTKSQAHPPPKSNSVNAAPPPYQSPQDYEKSYPKRNVNEEDRESKTNVLSNTVESVSTKKSKKKERKETSKEKEDREREKERRAAEKRKERKRFQELGRQVAKAMEEDKKVEKKPKKAIQIKQEIIQVTSSEVSEEESSDSSEDSSSSEEEVVAPKIKKSSSKNKRPVSPTFSSSSKMSTGSTQKSPSPPKQGKQSSLSNPPSAQGRDIFPEPKPDLNPPGRSDRRAYSPEDGRRREPSRPPHPLSQQFRSDSHPNIGMSTDLSDDQYSTFKIYKGVPNLILFNSPHVLTSNGTVPFFKIEPFSNELIVINPFLFNFTLALKHHYNTVQFIQILIHQGINILPFCNPFFLHHVSGLSLGFISFTHSLLPLTNAGPCMKHYFIIKENKVVHNNSFRTVDPLTLNSTLSQNILNLLINMSTHLPILVIEELITRINIINPYFQCLKGRIRPCTHSPFDSLFEHGL